MKILLIEDDQKVSRIVSTGLTAERFSVETAADGREGLDMATSNPYDLIIVDLSLPSLNGMEIIKRLRLTNAEVPVLVLTARDAVADKVAHFEAGADDYLTKPFVFVELVVRVKALLRRGPTFRSNAITVGDLEIDRMSRQARRAGKSIKLTSKEYALLEYLALNTGRILSRSMIVEHVWDESFEGLTNIVDVYIRQLRAKIDDSHSTKLIHTARGMGYYINEKELWL
ncbi:response regulator transcription factor [soil metagenome]